MTADRSRETAWLEVRERAASYATAVVLPVEGGLLTWLIGA
jgi:hypothetical protein